MLGAMLDGAKTGFLKYIILGFILLAAGGLVLTDVGGFFTGGAPLDSVASVGDKKITIQRFDREFRNLTYRQGISPAQAYQFGLAEQYLNSVIANALYAQAAEDNGIAYSSDVLAEDVRQFIAPYITEETDARAAFQNLLRSQNMNEKDFTEILATEKKRNLMISAITGPTAIPGDLAADIALVDAQKRHVDILNIDIEAMPDPKILDQETLLSYYEQIKNKYLISEKRTIEAVLLSPDALTVDISNDQIKTFYQENIAAYTSGSARQIEQVLLRDQDQAQKVFDLAFQSGDLKQAADDLYGTYQAPDYYSRDGLIDALAEPIYNAKIGTLLAPLKSPLGWHVIKVTGEKEGEVTPLAAVEKDIARTLKAEALQDQLYDLSSDIQDMLDGGASAKEVADKFELPLLRFSDIDTVTDKFEGLSENPQRIIEESFPLLEGETSMLFDDGPNYIALTVTAITPESHIPFEEIEASIRKDYIADQKTEAARTLALDTKAKIDNGTLDFRTAAAQNPAIRFEQAKNLSRLTKSQTALTQDNLFSVFAADPDETLYFENDGAFLIAKIDNIAFPDENALSGSDIDSQSEQLSTLFADLNAQRYAEGLQNRHKVKINSYVLEQLYAPQDN